MGKWFTRTCCWPRYATAIKAIWRRTSLAIPFLPIPLTPLPTCCIDSLKRESSTALLDGYSIAGKTGTAQIPTSTGYDPDNINASFIGWGPVEDPRFLVYVWLEKPQSNKAASVVAAPIFKQVIEKLVVFLGIPPDSTIGEIRKMPDNEV